MTHTVRRYSDHRDNLLCALLYLCFEHTLLIQMSVINWLLCVLHVLLFTLGEFVYARF